MTLTFKDSIAYGAESGIVILKKIPKGQQKNKHKGEESTIPEFKPLKTDDSDEFTFKNIVGKFFHASTSLQPDEPTVQTDESSNNDEIEVEPPEGYVEVEALRKPAPVVNDNDNSPSLRPSPTTFLSSKKPNTFETVNYETHPELYEQQSGNNTSFKLSQQDLDFLKNYFNRFKLNQSQIVNTTKTNNNKNIKPEDLPNIESFPPYPGQLPVNFITKHGLQNQGFGWQSLPFGGFQLKVPSNPFDEIKTNAFDPRYKRYPNPSIKYQFRSPQPQKIRPARPPSKHFSSLPPQRQKSPSQPQTNLVKSVTYKLTPNGPIKM